MSKITTSVKFVFRLVFVAIISVWVKITLIRILAVVGPFLSFVIFLIWIEGTILLASLQLMLFPFDP